MNPFQSRKSDSHKDLPIYKVTYDLAIHIAEVTRHMSRDFKSSLGGEMRKEAIGLCLLIYRANSARNKVPHLDELLERVQVVELTLRLAHDMRLISVKQYASAIELTDKIGKQANGWRKQSANNLPAI